MGGLVAEAGGASMNDDDLLFGVDDLEGYNRGEQPEGWLSDQHDLLEARCRAQTAKLEKLLASAPPAIVARFDEPI